MQWRQKKNESKLFYVAYSKSLHIVKNTNEPNITKNANMCHSAFSKTARISITKINTFIKMTIYEKVEKIRNYLML